MEGIIFIISAYSAKFSRRTIFADWRFQKFRGKFSRTKDSVSESIRYSKISRSLIFEARCQPRKTRKLCASKIWRYTVNAKSPLMHSFPNFVGGARQRVVIVEMFLVALMVRQSTRKVCLIHRSVFTNYARRQNTRAPPNIKNTYGPRD